MDKKVDIVVTIKENSPGAVLLLRSVGKALKSGKIPHHFNIINEPSYYRLQNKGISPELERNHPITIYESKNHRRINHTLHTAISNSDAEYIALLDSKRYYPSETIAEMLNLAEKNRLQVVLAERVHNSSSGIFRFISSLNKKFIGGYFLNVNYDFSSGLILFKKDFIRQLGNIRIDRHTLSLLLANEAVERGEDIGTVEVPYNQSHSEYTASELFSKAVSIVATAIKTRFKRPKVHYLYGENPESQLGTGIIYRKKKFVTHSKLSHHKSALYVLQKWQKYFILSFLSLLVGAFLINPSLTGIALISMLSAVYFFDVLFTFYLTLKSLHFPPEIQTSEDELKSLEGIELPVYSVMCPLYKEAEVLPQFVKSMEAMDWPKEKLDVLLLLEEDDKVTQEAAKNMQLPGYIRTIIVPHSLPKTKPKACNYGLHLSKGEYVVIYDAEDIPDPLQLKKVYLAFQKVSDDVFCVQGKLNYYNPHQNLLTTLFTAEYSLWFDIILPGLQSIGTTIPLGGTSNHFRTKGLRDIKGWDPFNVTEDCDLGVRLFKEGYKTAIVDSTTLEEANSNLKNWVRQRSRWIKGYFQTYLVHMRNPVTFFKKHKGHALLFQLIIGLRISFILINPILWVTTISYFVFYDYVGLAIEALYPPLVFYMAAFSLVCGNFLYLYNYMIGLAKRGRWEIIKYVFLVPFYWLMMSIAAVMAFWQLIFKPHFWEKTHHGLHLAHRKKLSEEKENIKVPFIKPAFSPSLVGGGILIASTLGANFANFVYNAYLGRQVNLAQFGTVSLISNIFTIAAVFSNSLGRAVAYKTAFLFGKLQVLNKDFYSNVQRFTWVFSLLATAIWISAIPLLARFFNESDLTPFWLFTPYWMVTFVGSVNSGFLSGAHKFAVLGASMLIDAFSKVSLAVLAVETGNTDLVYAVIPATVVISFLFEAYVVSRIKPEPSDAPADYSFPSGYYLTTVFTKVSSVIFLSADVILAKHFLSPADAGRYALLSLAGKIVYFLGNLLSQFIIPVISKAEGKNQSSKAIFYRLLAGSALLSAAGFIGIGIFGSITVPVLFGSKAVSVTGFLPQYTLSMLVFSVSFSLVSYHQIKKRYFFTLIPLSYAILEVFLISTGAPSITSFVGIIVYLSYFQLGTVLTLHFLYPKLENISEYLSELLNSALVRTSGYTGEESALPAAPGLPVYEKKLNILIYNWRDTKHVWAGGAEVYVQEMAKQWVNAGHSVTIFCGNDRKSPQHGVIDGVRIIRRGGFFTVYIWGALHYLLRIGKSYDVVIDSENGVPFFSPLYVRKPVVLLIHHVHKDVVLNELKLPKYLLPFAFLARQLETKLMPLVYRNSKVVAVSQSTKTDLAGIGFGEDVEIVNPGVDMTKFRKSEKSPEPSILYLGRIKFYKSIDTLIKAHRYVTEKIPSAKLNIAGFGEARRYLETLTGDWDMCSSVNFLGKVSEEEKVNLMGQSWVFVYPSSMEGWGISIIEANACGTAVVASDVPGLRDSVKNPSTGYLVEKGNEEGFAKAILELLTNHDLRKKFENEGVRWAGNFTWEKCAGKFLEILIDVSRKRKSPANNYQVSLNTK